MEGFLVSPKPVQPATGIVSSPELPTLQLYKDDAEIRESLATFNLSTAKQFFSPRSRHRGQQTPLKNSITSPTLSKVATNGLRHSDSMVTIDGVITKTKENPLSHEHDVTIEEEEDQVLPLIRGRLCNERLCSPGLLGYRTTAVNLLAEFSGNAIRRSRDKVKEVNPKEL